VAAQPVVPAPVIELKFGSIIAPMATEPLSLSVPQAQSGVELQKSLATTTSPSPKAVQPPIQPSAAQIVGHSKKTQPTQPPIQPPQKQAAAAKPISPVAPQPSAPVPAQPSTPVPVAVQPVSPVAPQPSAPVPAQPVKLVITNAPVEVYTPPNDWVEIKKK